MGGPRVGPRKPGKRGKGKKGLSGGSIKRPPDKTARTLSDLGITKTAIKPLAEAGGDEAG
jgi:hypothetical protein